MPENYPHAHPLLKPPIIQMAGARSLDEALLAAKAGATHLGLPLRLDVHTPDVDDRTARDIVAALPETLMPALITYQRRPEDVVELCAKLGVRVVQLHGDISIEELAELRRLAPELAVIKSLIVGQASQDALLERMRACAPLVHAFITDTFDPSTGASGATGRTHDWSVSRALAAASPRPLILAGGLDPENVARAVNVVQPAGVDAHTGLEDASGAKDFEKMKAFAARALQAWRKM